MPLLVSPFVGTVVLILAIIFVARFVRQDRAINRMRRAQVEKTARRG